MADSKISALNGGSPVTAATGDLVPIVDISDTSQSADGTTSFTTVSSILALASSSSPIIQTKEVTDTTNRSTTSATFVATGVEAVLANNLKDTGSRVRIRVAGAVGGSTTAGVLFTIFSWDGVTETDLKPGTVNALAGVLITSSAGLEDFQIIDFIHSPASTTPLTYRLAWNTNAGTANLGRRNSDTFYDVPTYMTLEELD